MISISPEGRHLCVRIDIDQAHPELEQALVAFQRASQLSRQMPGQKQLVRTAYAALHKAIVLTLTDNAPDVTAEVRKLNETPL